MRIMEKLMKTKQKIFKEIGAIFITTSAKEPNGIYELFNRIKVKYLEKIPKDRFDFDIPGKYL